MAHWTFVVAILLAIPGGWARADCFAHHAARFGLEPELLRAIALVESGGRAHALNGSHVGRTGTRDLGLMQINSAWLPTLRLHGIQERDLLEPCTSIEVGAWVLADLVARHGNSWDAVGAYNAACTQLKGQACINARARYTWLVHNRLTQLRAAAASPAAGGTSPHLKPHTVRPGPALVALSEVRRTPDRVGAALSAGPSAETFPTTAAMRITSPAGPDQGT